jgi:hypothetical protein
MRCGVVGRGARSLISLRLLERYGWGGVAPVPPGPTSLRNGVTTESGHELTERRYCWARAYRDGEIVCVRVQLTVTADTRLGLVRRERSFTARFWYRLDPDLHAELADLVRRRGVVARRAAERMRPIEIVFDDPFLGRQRILGCVEPPQLRHGELHEITFDISEAAR